MRWDRVFGNHDEVQVDLATAVPAALRGTLFRNGPGVMSVGPDLLNYYDANGMIAAVSFEDGRARLVMRHVRTAMFDEERAAGRQRQRRLLTNKPGRWSNLFVTKLGVPASHDVFVWGGRLFATQSLGHYALDPHTLETLGPDRFGGAAPVGETMCPMPRPDRALNRLVTYTIGAGPGGRDVITFREFAPDWTVVATAKATLCTRAFGVHDLAFTPRWYLVPEVPSAIDKLKAAWGAGPLWDAVQWPEGDTVLHVVPRGREGKARIVPLPRSIHGAYHIANAWEEGEELVVELVTYEGMPNFEAGYPEPLRAARPPLAHPTTPSGPQRVRIASDDTVTVAARAAFGELPEIDERLHGLAHRFTWLLAPGQSGGEPDPELQIWRHAITRVDRDGGVATWDAGPTVCLSQPCFAGTGAPEEGYILAFAFSLETALAEVVVLDSADPAQGPVARVPLGVFLSPASHARFEPNVWIRGAS